MPEVRSLSVGASFPQFNKKACVSIEPGKEFGFISSEDHKKSGKWMVMFWWPKDFTFICPTEIAAFNEKTEDFQSKNSILIGASTDTEYVHLAWRNQDPNLRNLQFPMVADTNKSLAEELGILSEDEKVAYRATYIVDPNGIIRWVNINDLDVGRNVDEVLRVLSGLLTGERVPCNWVPGQATLGR
ncbi:MAG: peroxiredoxin [Bacteroidetes bacterium]|nr:peroxiredoxin [Bacteroidota bacterium]